MAVYAAHLTRTLQGTPSVFQITAQEALGSTVKPAIRKLFEYLAAVYPNKFGWTLRWYDELYLAFDGLLQYHYLKHYAASFSESFYGLLRVPLHSSGEFHTGQRLPHSAEVASLVALVILPYVRGKCEAMVNKWRDDREDGLLGKSNKDSLKRAAIRVYSLVHLAVESARLWQLARYLAGGSRSASPALLALGLALRDAPPPAEGYGWGELARGLMAGDLGALCPSFPRLGALALPALQYLAFALQFLRWWDAAPAAAPALAPPPPPPASRLARADNKCPLCMQPWRIPAVLPVSGLVFCYKCISRHLRASACCPATGYPATEDSLVRLYVDT